MGAHNSKRRSLSVVSRVVLKRGDRIRHAIHDVFREYDRNGSGHIDLQELSCMVEELSCIAPHLQVSDGDASKIAVVVVKELDTSGNGKIEEDEFSWWLEERLTWNEAEKRDLLLAGYDGEVLHKFLSACEVCIRMQLAGIGIFPEVHGTDSGIEDTVASSAPVHEHIRLRQDPKSIEPMFLREAIVELFRQYDMNQTGYVDHDQITSMVYEIKLARRKVSNVEGQPSGLSWANQGFVADKIIDALDRDGNRRIDENEFTTWLIGRICAHHEHRDDSHGKMNDTMAEFFVAAEQLVAKLRRDMINARERGLRAGTNNGARKEEGTKTDKAQPEDEGSSQFRDALTQIFFMYDTNGDGTIVADELATMVTELMDARLEAQGEPHKSQIEARINLDAAKLIIKALDTDGDKKLNLKEFCKLVTNAAVNWDPHVIQKHAARISQGSHALQGQLVEFYSALIWCTKQTMKKGGISRSTNYHSRASSRAASKND